MKKLILCVLCILFLLAAACQKRQQPVSGNKSGNDPEPLSLCGLPSAVLNTPPGFDGKLVPLFAGLTENFSYPVTTTSKEAQKYFDQGLMLAFGFNHPEAARSFREAARQDPGCAMAYWGLGYVLGPNYNSVMDVNVLPQALEAVSKAQLLAHQATPKERALIDALSRRYPKTKDEDPQPYYQAYAKALDAVRQQFPGDLDIAALHAEALMDLHPWDLYEKNGDLKPWTPEMLRVLESILAKNPRHPQANHLYIHATEAGGQVEKALPYANTLRRLVPGAGHLLHMPSHIYINTGHYHEGCMANERAIRMDSLYLEACNEAGIYGLALYPHNWHFLAACAALEGRAKRALEASRFMAEQVVNREMMRIPDLATLQHYISIPWFIQVKFARWDEILKEPVPDADLAYPNAIRHYARGMAYSAKGNFAAARRELSEIERLEKDSSIATLTIWGFNKLTDVTRIARHVLEGDIAWRQGKHETSIALLQKAVGFEDQLQYQEPPDWFFSVRHLLGHVLISSQKYGEAERVYRQDLKKWKENGWALKGLYLSLIRQSKTTEAGSVQARFEKAWQYADVRLESSILQ